MENVSGNENENVSCRVIKASRVNEKRLPHNCRERVEALKPFPATLFNCAVNYYELAVKVIFSLSSVWRGMTSHGLPDDDDDDVWMLSH